MEKIFKIKFNKQMFTNSILAVFLFAQLIFPFQISARAPQVSYTVKLISAQPRILENLGSQVRRRFEFSKDAQLANIYTFDSAFPEAELAFKLKGRYLYLQRNADLRLAATTNDPGLTTNPLNIDKQWGLAKAGFLAAWDKTTGSRQQVVAVIDTGIDATHEDLANANYVVGFDFLKNQSILPGTNSDDNGHGTLVAGILAATPNNGLGIVGTNWQLSLMPLKALDSDGTGTSADIAEAIVWAADHGASVINLSLGGIGFGHDTTLANAIAHAYGKDSLIVAAAGNDTAERGSNLDSEPVFPVCDDNGENMILGVAATDQNDLKPAFSNFGKSCIDVAAPGKRILSAINHDPITKKVAPNAYAYASGTSMAAPFVAGEAALLRALFPLASNRQIRDRIITSADSIDSQNLSQCGGAFCRGLLGAGRINAATAVAAEILRPKLSDGDLVKVGLSGPVYLINGGKKQLVSSFVKNQRFAEIQPTEVSASALAAFIDGPYAEAMDGTLMKLDRDPTVFYMSKGLRLPVTAQVFALRNFQFSQVNTLSFSEMNSWLVGSFLAPTEGLLLRTVKNLTVYWVVSSVLHPINHNFFVQRGLNIFPVVYTTDEDIKSFPKGEAYIL